MFLYTMGNHMENLKKMTKDQLIAELNELRARLQRGNDAEEIKYRQMLLNLPQIVFEIDTEGRFTFTNDFGLNVFQRTRQEFEDGLHFKQVLHPDSHALARKNIARLLGGNHSQGEEYLAIRKDGTTFPIKIYSQGVFDNGQPVGIRGIVIDISDIRQAEKSLSKSENYYRTLFENTGTAIVILDKDNVIHSCNAQFAALSGYATEEIEDRIAFSDFVGTRCLEMINEKHPEKQGHPHDCEFTFVSRNNKGKRVRAFIQAIPETEYTECSLIDVTSRDRIARALRESEKRYELVVRGANDGIWDWNLTRDAIYFSPRYKAILGYSDNEFLNLSHSWGNAVHPEDLGNATAAKMECLNGIVDQFQTEYRMLHKDGFYRWVQERGASTKDRDGKVYRLAGTLTDITKRALNEQTTQALYAISKAISTTNDLRELYETIHLILGKVIDANNFFIAILDKESDRLVFSYFEDERDDYYEICNVSDLRTRSLTAHVIRTGKPLFFSEADPAKAGLQAEIGVVGTPAAVWLGVPLKVQGKIMGAMAVQHYTNPSHYSDKDVALMKAISEQVALAIERKTNEEKLNQLNEELESKVDLRTSELIDKAAELETANKRLKELDEIKSSLISSISHELRTPLTSIRGFAKLTGKDFMRHFHPLADNERLENKGNRIRKNLEIIEAEGERLTRLINDFLDINRIESGKTAWHDKFLNPCDMVCQATNALAGSFAARPEVKLNTDLPKTISPIHADPDKVQQVLINLLNNACKFTVDGTVTVSVVDNTDTVTVTVADTGIGIEAKEQQRIFDRFHKAALKDSAFIADKGTGLGLAICKEIVEHYGGSIWVESMPGKGSAFSFTLPSLPGVETSCC